MARWVAGAGRWADCHMVLTRAGCLHWFEGGPPTPAAPLPAGSLALARCQLDAGTPGRSGCHLREHQVACYFRT